MIEVKVKVWRDDTARFEKAIAQNPQFRILHVDARNRHTPYFTATVSCDYQWNLFNTLGDYGEIRDMSEVPWAMQDLYFEFGHEPAPDPKALEPVQFELDCGDKESGDIVRDILLDKNFRVSVQLRGRITLVMQNGYEGLAQVKDILRGFGLKVRKEHGKMVWRVMEA